MSIIMDAGKQLIAIDLYYIEKKKIHGNSVFHVIKSKDEMDYWTDRDYVLENKVPKDENGPTVPEDKIINILQTHWKSLSWRDQNTVFTKSIRQIQRPDGSFSAEIDTITYRDQKLKTCLRKWDLTGPDGQNLEVTEGLIDNLNPVIAQELLSAFEKVTEPTEEDLKQDDTIATQI